MSDVCVVTHASRIEVLNEGTGPIGEHWPTIGTDMAIASYTERYEFTTFSVALNGEHSNVRHCRARVRFDAKTDDFRAREDILFDVPICRECFDTLDWIDKCRLPKVGPEIQRSDDHRTITGLRG